MGGVRKAVTMVTKLKYPCILLIRYRNIEIVKGYKWVTLWLRVTVLRGYKLKI